MKVVLIYPDILKSANWQGYYYSGIGYLASSLIEAGHDVELLHITKKPTEQEFNQALAAKLRPGNCQIIAFSATTNMYCFVEKWSAWAKKSFKVFTIVGGIHPTLCPEETIACPSLDAICIGEGEAALVELADNLSNNKPINAINNLWIKLNGDIIKNPVRPLVADLDSLPFPNRSLFDYPRLELEANGYGVFMASRGCPYRCTYCCNDALAEVYSDRSQYTRFRSPANVIKEIDEVIRQYPFIHIIHFNDDILPLRREWFEEFAVLYKEKIGLPFECNIRPNLVNENVTSLLKETGCLQVRLGIESGDERIRNKVLKRGLSQERLISACRQLKNAGILIYSFNMVGLPFEGPKEMLKTIKLNAVIDFDESQISIFEPFPKTGLFDICEKEGMLTNQTPTDYHKDTMLTMSRSKHQQVLFFTFYFRLIVKIYSLLMRLPGRIGSAAIRLTDSILSSRIAANFIFPIFIGLYRTIRRNRRLERFVRKTARKLLYRSGN